mmetsp:Transcript_22022/g.67852  ORF Transcript_22022/g.67852 Transcript_22022/m.67852 type:complete len:399 (+) Transcript_22022:317-1513(+)
MALAVGVVVQTDGAAPATVGRAAERRRGGGRGELGLDAHRLRLPADQRLRQVHLVRRPLGRRRLRARAVSEITRHVVRDPLRPGRLRGREGAPLRGRRGAALEHPREREPHAGGLRADDDARGAAGFIRARVPVGRRREPRVRAAARHGRRHVPPAVHLRPRPAAGIEPGPDLSLLRPRDSRGLVLRRRPAAHRRQSRARLRSGGAAGRRQRQGVGELRIGHQGVHRGAIRGLPDGALPRPEREAVHRGVLRVELHRPPGNSRRRHDVRDARHADDLEIGDERHAHGFGGFRRLRDDRRAAAGRRRGAPRVQRGRRVRHGSRHDGHQLHHGRDDGPQVRLHRKRREALHALQSDPVRRKAGPVRLGDRLPAPERRRDVTSSLDSPHPRSSMLALSTSV